MYRIRQQNRLGCSEHNRELSHFTDNFFICMIVQSNADKRQIHVVTIKLPEIAIFLHLQMSSYKLRNVVLLHTGTFKIWLRLVDSRNDC